MTTPPPLLRPIAPAVDDQPVWYRTMQALIADPAMSADYRAAAYAATCVHDALSAALARHDEYPLCDW
jgi:hypothetical protein